MNLFVKILAGITLASFIIFFIFVAMSAYLISVQNDQEKAKFFKNLAYIFVISFIVFGIADVIVASIEILKMIF